MKRLKIATKGGELTAITIEKRNDGSALTIGGATILVPEGTEVQLYGDTEPKPAKPTKRAKALATAVEETESDLSGLTVRDPKGMRAAAKYAVRTGLVNSMRDFAIQAGLGGSYFCKARTGPFRADTGKKVKASGIKINPDLEGRTGYVWA